MLKLIVYRLAITPDDLDKKETQVVPFGYEKRVRDILNKFKNITFFLEDVSERHFTVRMIDPPWSSEYNITEIDILEKAISDMLLKKHEELTKQLLIVTV